MACETAHHIGQVTYLTYAGDRWKCSNRTMFSGLERRTVGGMAGSTTNLAARTVGTVAGLLLVVALAARSGVRPTSCLPTTLVVMPAPTAEAAEGVAAAVHGLGGAGTLRDLPRLGEPTAPADGAVLSISWVWDVWRTQAADEATSDRVVVGWAHHPTGATADREILLRRQAALTATGPASWEALTLHELGHHAGLAHSDRPGDVMYSMVEAMGTSFTSRQSSVVRAFESELTCR